FISKCLPWHQYLLESTHQKSISRTASCKSMENKICKNEIPRMPRREA
ncbi:MAG: hypothetical protein ACI9HG_001217, partial [Flavobacteriales bacterium]